MFTPDGEKENETKTKEESKGLRLKSAHREMRDVKDGEREIAREDKANEEKGRKSARKV